MKTVCRRTFAIAVSVTLLAGCSLFKNHRDDKFTQIKIPPQLLLLLVGGNSECRANKGLWPIKDDITSDLSAALGLDEGVISTDYIAWTGDPADDPGCLPGNAQYLNGHIAITRQLKSYAALEHTTQLVVVGWSNGGATAAQLSEYLYDTTGIRQIDLLVTLDPVSILTSRTDSAQAKLWLNVYTESSGFNKLRLTNIIAFFGGAWNDFDGPDLVTCMKGNHNEVLRMWRGIILPSMQFQDWANNTRRILDTDLANIDTPSTVNSESC